ncbi:MAG: ATP-binding protein [Succinimonas sp.]|nr:ATP-binding protein [Succinimonas sp.]
MLLEFSCSNHRSIREKVLFSALAGADDTHKEKLISFAKYRVLRSALIYGANGSGKSNFIDAISFVKNLVTNSINHQIGQGIRQTPHKLESGDSESTYSIQFVTKGIRYMYGFTLKNFIVVDEYLYYVPKGRQTKIFERSDKDFATGSKFNGKLAACKDVLKPNRLLLSCAANFSAVSEIADAYRFFFDELVVYNPLNQNNWMNYSLYKMNTDIAMKKAVLDLMRDLGTNIKDIRVTIDTKKIELAQLPPFLSDEFKNILLQQNIDAITADVIYDDFIIDLFQEESTGVRKLFALLCPLIDIMTNNKIIVCDELETSLHEAVLYGLIKLFTNLPIDNSSQLFFTTHETGLLDLDVFRRDQIWFTELKNDDRATDLYSLAELKNVRKDEKYSKGYISGRYGAIPMLNVDIVKFLAQ